MIKSNFDNICSKYTLTKIEVISFEMFINKKNHHKNDKTIILEKLYLKWKEEYR